MNLKLGQAEVTTRCADAGIVISAIETLPSGGTHLVLVTGDDAAKMRRLLRAHVIEGRVPRFAFMHARTRPNAEPPAPQRSDVLRTMLDRNGLRGR